MLKWDTAGTASACDGFLPCGLLALPGVLLGVPPAQAPSGGSEQVLVAGEPCRLPRLPTECMPGVPPGARCRQRSGSDASAASACS
jgi:hypothetical protein